MPADTVITLRDNTASVSNRAFYQCANLKQIAFNNGIISIGDNAFYCCTSLDEVAIPQGLSVIGNSSFYGCSSLNRVHLNEGVTEIKSTAFYNCTALETINLPNSIKKIGYEAFRGDVSLTGLVLPNSLTEIGYDAFRGCTSLTEITIPATLTTVSYPFNKCDNLSKMVFADGCTVIPATIAEYCYGLEEVIIPDTVTEIGANAFYDCKALETIIIPDSVTKIGVAAFCNNKGLKNVTLSKNVTTINNDAFGYCTSLTNIFIPKTLTSTGTVFSNSGLTKVELETGATIVPSSLFNSCKSLTTVILPSSLTEIKSTAFYNCTALETINLPNSIKKIGYEAFRGDVSLTGLVLPNSLTEIGYDAFRGCTSLTEITIPATLTTVSYPFNKCDNLSKMVFADGCTVIPATIAEYCYGLEEVIIPDTVTEIGENAFYECKALNDLYLPATMEKVRKSAFYGCNKLTVYCSKYSKIVIGFMDDGKDIITYNDTRSIESIALDEPKSYYEARNTTGSSFVCNYSIKSSVYSAIKNPYIKIKIPAGAVIADQSLYANDTLCTDFSDYTSYITVPVKSREGRITFNLTFTGDCKMATYATLNYTMNGKSDYDIIDIINNDIPVIAVYSEDITSSDSVHVSGMAPVSTDVKIAVDGTDVSTVTSNKAGSFSADIKLPSLKDGKEYTVVASAEYLGETIMNETTVTYRENAPELISFTMGYKGVTYDLLSGKSYSISFVPNSTYPFHFDVKFKNPEGVSSVYVYSTRNQARKSVEAKWNDDTQSFVFDGFFDRSNYAYVPGKITVSFSLKQKDIQEPTIDDFREIVESAEIKVNKQTSDEYNADIDFGNGSTWNYDERVLSAEELEVELQASFENSSGEFAPTGALPSGIQMIFIEYVNKLIEKYGEKVVSNVTKDAIESSEPLEAYVKESDKDEITRYFYDPAAKVVKKQTIKYALGTGAYMLGSIQKSGGIRIGVSKAFNGINVPAYKSAMKGAGVLVSTGKTLIDYGGQMYDVDKIDKQIRNSNMSSSQKSGYLKDLNTVRNGYTMVAAFDIAMACAGTLLFGPVGGALFGLATGIISSLVKDETDKLLDLVDSGTSSQMNFLVDPSGYVYACVESNRISGAKVTTYWIPYDEEDEEFWENPDESKQRIWEADEYSQVNPLFTDDNGDYAWDVPEGWWKVVVEKEGYETFTTEWLPVPPPQTEVNVGLMSNSTPSIVKTQIDNKTLTFSEYMNPDTLDKISIKDLNDEEISYQLAYSKDEKDRTGKVFAKEYQFVLNTDYTIVHNYYVIFIEEAENYSGIPFSGYVEFGEKPETPEEYLLGDVDSDGEVTIIDATFIQRKLASLHVESYNETAADTDGDGEITILDATFIQRWLANLPSNDNIGKPIN